MSAPAAQRRGPGPGARRAAAAAPVAPARALPCAAAAAPARALPWGVAAGWSRSIRRAASCALATLLPLAASVPLAACRGEEDSLQPLSRSGPLGSLRDLVLFERPPESGGPFFLDRFEATRADWAEFAASPAGRAAGAEPTRPDEAELALPAAGMDLRLARAFAAWRRCRLPRSEEWAYAVGVTTYPWGNMRPAARANTAELGLFEPLPVGTFESGRRGAGPYDLIGNVAEWTESVPVHWARRDPLEAAPSLSAFERAMRRWAGSPGLAVWHVGGALPAQTMLVQAAGRLVPREVVGSDFATPMAEKATSRYTTLRQWRSPGEASSTIGVRVAAAPHELLLALARDFDGWDAEQRRQWQRFLVRDRHAAVLGEAWPRTGLSDAQRRAMLGDRR